MSRLTLSFRNVKVPAGQKLQQLSAKEFTALLQSIFSVLTDRLQRVSSIHQLIEAVTASALATQHNQTAVGESFQKENLLTIGESQIDPTLEPHRTVGTGKLFDIPGVISPLINSEFSESYCAQMLNDSVELLYSACELAHAKCSRILKMRTDVTSKLSLQDFVNLFNMTQNYMQETENICGKLCSGLRPALQAQVHLH
jgi:hypothetical protein